MRRSYVETFFRHKVVLVLPIVVAFALAVMAGLAQPREYVASSSVWADSRVPFETSIANTGGAEWPASSQQALLTGLLSTKAFLRGVAEASPLREEISTQTPRQADATLGSLAASVSLSTPGPQVLAIQVRHRDPAVATGVAEALVAQFMGAQGERLSERAVAQVAYDEEQAAAARNTLAASQQSLAAYQEENPRPPGQAIGDEERALVNAVALAQEQYSNAAEALSRSSSASAASLTAALSVIDQPDQAFPQSRRKILLAAGAGGLLAGLTLSTGLLVLLVTRDRSVHDETEVQEALGLRVVAVLDSLPASKLARFSAQRAVHVAGGQP